jgi:hypothetical protein
MMIPFTYDCNMQVAGLLQRGHSSHHGQVILLANNLRFVASVGNTVNITVTSLKTENHRKSAKKFNCNHLLT